MSNLDSKPLKEDFENDVHHFDTNKDGKF